MQQFAYTHTHFKLMLDRRWGNPFKAHQTRHIIIIYTNIEYKQCRARSKLPSPSYACIPKTIVSGGSARVGHVVRFLLCPMPLQRRRRVGVLVLCNMTLTLSLISIFIHSCTRSTIHATQQHVGLVRVSVCCVACEMIMNRIGYTISRALRRRHLIVPIIALVYKRVSNHLMMGNLSSNCLPFDGLTMRYYLSRFDFSILAATTRAISIESEAGVGLGLSNRCLDYSYDAWKCDYCTILG